MATQNELLHRLADQIPFREESDLRKFHADIDTAFPVATDDDTPPTGVEVVDDNV